MYLISAVNSIYTLCITLGGRVWEFVVCGEKEVTKKRGKKKQLDENKNQKMSWVCSSMR
jgi:hypothetical protein